MKQLCSLCLLMLLLLTPGFIQAQISETPIVMGTIVSINDSSLDSVFRRHERLQIQPSALFDLVQQNGFANEITWHLGNKVINSTLYEHDLRSTDYVLEIHTEKGVRTVNPGPCSTYRGWTAGGGEVRLSITPDRLAGFITDTDGQKYYLQPASDFQIAANYTVLYKPQDVLSDEQVLCGSEHTHSRHARSGRGSNSNARMACVETEVAIAADHKILSNFSGSTSALEAHLLNLKNGQEANYSFYPIEFRVVKTVIFTTAGALPWSATTSAGTMLDRFCCWAGSGNSSQLGCAGSNGFGVTHDLGEFWTGGGGISGGTAGIAWIGTVCNGMFRYSANENQGNLDDNTVLISHEQGHNFGAGHTSPPYIMNSYIISDADNFNSSSQSTIGSVAGSSDCLGNCGTVSCDDVITVTSSTANGNKQAGALITTSGSLTVSSPSIYDAPTVEIVSPLTVNGGTTFEIRSNGCN